MIKKFRTEPNYTGDILEIEKNRTGAETELYQQAVFVEEPLFTFSKTTFEGELTEQIDEELVSDVSKKNYQSALSP